MNIRDRIFAFSSIPYGVLPVQFALLLLLPGGWVQAQSQGNIRGTVRDQTGDVLPGVSVTAIHQDTDIGRTVVTGDDGTYNFITLRPGSYRLTSELSGFHAAVGEDFELLVGAEITQDLILSVATAAETLELQAASPLVEPTVSTADEFVTAKQIQALPLNGRDFLSLALLAGGADLDDTEEEPQDAQGTLQFGTQPALTLDPKFQRAGAIFPQCHLRRKQRYRN